MNRRESKLKSLLTLALGVFIGVGALWPGLVTTKGRKCFLKIINDSSDGSVSLGTILSITPSYLLKINNTENKYKEILLVGDFCFRKF